MHNFAESKVTIVTGSPRRREPAPPRPRCTQIGCLLDGRRPIFVNPSFQAGWGATLNVEIIWYASPWSRTQVLSRAGVALGRDAAGESLARQCGESEHKEMPSPAGTAPSVAGPNDIQCEDPGQGTHQLVLKSETLKSTSHPFSALVTPALGANGLAL